MLQVSRSYGLENGLSIPLMFGREGFAGVGIASEDKRRLFNQLNKEKKDLLTLYSIIFNEHITSKKQLELNYEFALPVLSKLNLLEKDLIKLLITGDKVSSIAAILNRSPKYCENTLARLREKMGGVSRDELEYLIGRLRLDEVIQHFMAK